MKTKTSVKRTQMGLLPGGRASKGSFKIHLLPLQRRRAQQQHSICRITRHQLANHGGQPMQAETNTAVAMTSRRPSQVFYRAGLRTFSITCLPLLALLLSGNESLPPRPHTHLDGIRTVRSRVEPPSLQDAFLAGPHDRLNPVDPAGRDHRAHCARE